MPQGAPGGALLPDIDVLALAEAVPHSIWVVSAGGNVEFANERAQQYSGGEVAWASLVHPEDAEAMQRAAAAAVLVPEPYEVACRIGAADGSFHWHSVGFTPVRRGDDPVTRWIVTGTDIAQRRELQDEINRAERRAAIEASHDQKLESLGRLSAGLAHEINTPIQFVGDNTRFLADAYRDMLDLLLVYRECMAPALGELQWSERTQRAQQAEVKADIEYLAAEIPAAISQSLEGVERVASLVRAMKSFSYKDSSKQAYADLNEAVRTTLTVARNEVKYVADVVLDLGELPDVRCHLGDLNQVFLNLLVNAADALQDRSERGEIRVTTTTAGPTAVISFADNGAGIPADIQQSIFEPFFTTKEVGKGTGQGLALARAVLDKHGGSIEVRSVVGVGTEFILYLPIAGKQDASA